MRIREKLRGLARRWVEQFSIRDKLLSVFALTLLLTLGLNLFCYSRIGRMMDSINRVYESNISIASFQDALDQVQDSLYDYLNGRYDALNDYYQQKSVLQERTSTLNDVTTGNTMALREKNIRSMTNSYFRLADEAVAAHRGTDIAQYGSSYEEATLIYGYLQQEIYQLNGERFAQNTESFRRLNSIQRYNQIMNVTLLLVFALLELLVIFYFTGRITLPLSILSQRAGAVGEGRLDMPPLEVDSQDEVGKVTEAFNTMTIQLNDYIRRQQEQMIAQSRLKEQKLQLEAHLKDAQLSALQAQINPHFLYNTLNAGMQLALMEDAEQTCLFLEKVADYYRYSLRKSGSDVTLAEELAQAENYIYIMNTRYAGEISYRRDTPEDLPPVRLPGMVLQPLVENAIMHGLHSVEQDKTLTISVRLQSDRVVVCVADNGGGFPEEKAAALLSGQEQMAPAGSRGNGIALVNVLKRLRLYFGRQDVLEIAAGADGIGTEMRILIPNGGIEDVSDLIGG